MVAANADAPAAVRAKSFYTATAIAEFFRDQAVYEKADFEDTQRRLLELNPQKFIIRVRTR